MSKEDCRALQVGARLRIEMAVLAEHLVKLSEEGAAMKRRLQAQEEVLRLKHVVRQMAMRRQLQQKVKRELVRREQTASCTTPSTATCSGSAIASQLSGSKTHPLRPRPRDRSANWAGTGARPAQLV